MSTLPSLSEALALMNQQAFAAARSICQQHLAHNANDFNARHLLGVLQLKSGNAIAACRELKRAAALPVQPRFQAQALSNLSLALQARNQFAQALEAVEQALTLQPQETAFQLNRLALLEQLGQWHAIQQLGTEQPELFEHPDARLALAVALRHQNSSSQALALLAPMLASPDSSIETESEWALNLCLSKGADALMAQVQQRQWSWQQCLQLADYIAEEASPASAACLYQAVLRLQPDNAHAQHMRDAAAGNCTAEAPAGYVQALYNTHATEFEHRLKQRLGYRAPEQLAQLLAELITPPERGLDVLDLGCGTGLCGQSLKSTLPIRYLAGCDLAQQMLELAADKNLYDALHCQDLLSALTQSKPVDLITATDVLIYTGDLHPVCQAAAGVLRDGGWFAFTVEAAEDDHPVSLQASGRYRHSHRHIESAANASGLRLLQCIRFPLRLEHQRQLTGLMAVLEYRPTHSDGNTPNS